jgi:hypothetical protein
MATCGHKPQPCAACSKSKTAVSTGHAGRIHSWPRRRALLPLIPLLLILTHATELTLSPSEGLAIVGNVAELRRAMSGGYKHIHIVNHMDISGLPATSGKYKSSLFANLAEVESITVCSRPPVLCVTQALQLHRL